MVKHIRTTHVGSLPRTPELLAANRKRSQGAMEDAEFFQILQNSVDQVVKRQVDLGIDIINEGEYGHVTSGAVDYASWWNYIFSRLGGLTMTDEDRWSNQDIVRSTPGNIRLTSFADRRDRHRFAEAYADPDSGIFTGRAAVGNPKFTGPITYIGQNDVQTDATLLNRAMAKAGAQQGFIAAISPGAAARLKDEFYGDENAVVKAAAQALKHEYKAITDAGLTVQLDAPDLAEAWDQINPEPTVADYRAWIRIRIDAINEALAGLPRAQTRLHICWGSWHGPHTTDIPFAEIIEEILRAKVGGYSFEAASPRHAHEWRVWQEYKLPENTVIYPGVVSHAMNMVEHPRLVADRIITFAELVGPENIIASTDCGLGGRLHHQIAWAKLESLVEGARIATKELF
ncbi:cobalamin-independent methionine synthase II family protein [Corynebacterium caspium]|uniref:cobalamin-independent methionine synthase II family protein n=1 Tax=Corynebacterium caspium TaxID=234828 RepID=UPI0003A3D1D6|nr:cobalamin-independent methionine synthase II family protein [Corynebacterium caspium]WKD59017.1 2-hydroxypropyl-CoM lyase [Corynebacterium caspium DSM 44850]